MTRKQRLNRTTGWMKKQAVSRLTNVIRKSPKVKLITTAQLMDGRR